MTSESGIDCVGADQIFFECSCGSTVEINNNDATCWRCGETFEVRGCIETQSGKKYRIRIRKRRRHRATEQALWPTGPAVAIAQFNRHLSGASDYDQRCTRTGLMILLAPIYIPLILYCASFVYSPEPVTREGVIVDPRPTDCGFLSNCHYEKRTRQEKGYTIVTWERVND